MPRVVVKVENLSKRFEATHRQEAVDAVIDVSFELIAGETLALVGESGSGKTTVGRCILGLETPSSGRISFTPPQGRPSDADLKRRQVVFQDPSAALNPRMRVGASIEEPLRVLTRSEFQAAHHLVDKAIERAHFPQDLLRRYPHELSAGQQQRACIARALVSEPDLVVLDEPTSMLDASLRAGLVEMLRRLQQQLGLSYLFITHDLSTTSRIAHRMVVMNRGRIVETGRTDELFASPQHPYTRALLDAVLTPSLPANGRVVPTANDNSPEGVS